MVGERGSMVPLVAVLALVAVVSMLVITELLAVAVREADAQTAADMAALAAVYEGRTGAEELAASNGAELVEYWSTTTVVHVVVAIGTSQAAASATFELWPEVDVENELAG